LADPALDLVEQAPEHLAVPPRRSGHLDGDHGLCVGIDCQVDLEPGAALARPALAHLPLPSPNTFRPVESTTTWRGPERSRRGIATRKVRERRDLWVWSGTGRFSPVSRIREPANPSRARYARENTAFSVSSTWMARSE